MQGSDGYPKAETLAAWLDAKDWDVIEPSGFHKGCHKDCLSPSYQSLLRAIFTISPTIFPILYIPKMNIPFENERSLNHMFSQGSSSFSSGRSAKTHPAARPEHRPLPTPRVHLASRRQRYSSVRTKQTHHSIFGFDDRTPTTVLKPDNIMISREGGEQTRNPASAQKRRRRDLSVWGVGFAVFMCGRLSTFP